MKIQILGELPLALSDQDYQVHNNVDALLAALQINHCITLNLPEPEQSEVLKQLRADPLGALVPIICESTAPGTAPLYDGVRDANLKDLFQTYLKRLAQMQLEDWQDSLNARLIAHLWLLPSRKLEPAFNKSEWSFSYLLLTAWQAESPISWLSTLQQSKVIARDALTNRVRECKACSSSALNYIETCPSCNSINIDKFSALHCFTCGHVAAEAEFRQNYALSCPNCNTQLRHIGVDYDRPMENHQCGDCNHLFAEGEVKANCLSCGHSNALEDLKQRDIYSYKLAEQGIIWVQTGRELTVMPEGLGEPVSPEHFRWLLQWQNSLALRHQQTHLLMALRFTNLHELYEQSSDEQVLAKLDEFFQRIRALIRQTDIVCYWRSDLLVFLLVNCSEQHTLTLQNKLLELSEHQSDNPLELNVSYQALPDQQASTDIQGWLEQVLADVDQ